MSGRHERVLLLRDCGKYFYVVVNSFPKSSVRMAVRANETHSNTKIFRSNLGTRRSDRHGRNVDLRSKVPVEPRVWLQSSHFRSQMGKDEKWSEKDLLELRRG